VTVLLFEIVLVRLLVDFLNIIDFLFDWDELLFMNRALHRASADSANYAAGNCRCTAGTFFRLELAATAIVEVENVNI
jgi:hypothetical protein